MVSLRLLTRDVVERLEAAAIQVEGLYLFGSRARGAARRDSDIDLLLVSPSFVRQGFWARCADVGEALCDLTQPVDVYPVTPREFSRPEPGGFVESIRQELRPLMRRRSRARARLVKRRR